MTKKRERITSIDVGPDGEIIFYFENTDGAHRLREYSQSSVMWEDLYKIQSAIHWFNSISDAQHGRGVTLRS